MKDTMKIIQEKIALDELKNMAEKMFGYLVKAVVDIEKEIMVVDADFHADQEELLLDNESEQGNLWGINIHPDKYGDLRWIVFDSMINMRPSWGNKTRGVDDPEVQEKIRNIVKKLVQQ